MAYYSIRGGRRVYVYYWDSDLGKQVALPRSQTKHLDGQSEATIRYWVQEYEKTAGIVRPPDYLDNPTFERHVADYLEWRRQRGKSECTIDSDKRALLRWVLPYFITVRGLADPLAWPTVSAQMLTHLQEHGVSVENIKTCNSSLRGFWQFLQDKQVLPLQPPIRVIPPVTVSKTTPLKKTVTPVQMLEFVIGCDNQDVKLMALLGYFFSLRTQEVLGLRPMDFRAGSVAAGLQCGKVMPDMQLFDRLAVHIDKQRRQTGEVVDPKAHSLGWVACFNEKAAKLIVGMLKDRLPDQRLFQKDNDFYLKLWRRRGFGSVQNKTKPQFAAVTMKDLRRASIYWLGHNTKFGGNMVALRSHARHKKWETTGLYLRRPEEMVTDTWTGLDLQA